MGKNEEKNNIIFGEASTKKLMKGVIGVEEGNYDSPSEVAYEKLYISDFSLLQLAIQHRTTTSIKDFY